MFLNGRNDPVAKNQSASESQVIGEICEKRITNLNLRVGIHFCRVYNITGVKQVIAGRHTT